MMKYGAEHEEHRFSLSFHEAETEGNGAIFSWYLHIAEGEVVPEGLFDPSILVICNQAGEIVQIVLHDEGCDSEFQFTLMRRRRKLKNMSIRLENV